MGLIGFMHHQIATTGCSGPFLFHSNQRHDQSIFYAKFCADKFNDMRSFRFQAFVLIKGKHHSNCNSKANEKKKHTYLAHMSLTIKRKNPAQIKSYTHLLLIVWTHKNNKATLYSIQWHLIPFNADSSTHSRKSFVRHLWIFSPISFHRYAAHRIVERSFSAKVVQIIKQTAVQWLFRR